MVFWHPHWHMDEQLRVASNVMLLEDHVGEAIRSCIQHEYQAFDEFGFCVLHLIGQCHPARAAVVLPARHSGTWVPLGSLVEVKFGDIFVVVLPTVLG